MKKILLVVTIIIALFLGYQNRIVLAETVENIVYQSSCAAPKEYTIGAVDERFDISREDFIAVSQDAGSLWRNDEGMVLLQYAPEAKLPISLIYDERQYLSRQVDQLNNQVEDQKDALKPEISEYEQRASEFKRRNAALNERVNYWNNQGGAPEDEYNKLLQEQKALQSEADKLRNIAEELNQSTDAYNSQIQALDQKVENYNDTLEVKPEEGIYIREGRNERIEVYFNNTRPELTHTLAHEMGHAIGMPHNNNPVSIMYPKTNPSTELSNDDLADLIKVCEKRSVVDTTGQKFAILFEGIRETTIDALQQN